MNEIFTITPAASRALVFLAVFGALLLALLLLFGWIAWAGRATTFEVTAEGLRIRSAVYGRTLPAAVLRIDEARVVDLRTETGLRPGLRTNGIGLPGFSSGWFRLGNRERALVFLTDRERVVHIPTTEGYSVLLSTPRADEFVRALQRHAGARE